MPPFSKQRRNTVYDLTALRIHHDDFRIPSSDSNYRYRRDKKIIRDVRGNWIAKDAGGTGKIPWYTKVDGGEDEDEEEGEDMEVDKDEEGDVTQGAVDTEKEDEGGSSEDEEYRRGQRRRFYEDMSYLNDHVEPQQPSGSMPVPDSDLLKTIHYFASVYYNDMGQLYDSKRRAAQLKKRKRMQEEDSSDPSGDEDANGEGGLKPEIEDEGEEQDEEDWIDEDLVPTGDEDDSDEEGSQPRKRQAISKGKGKERDEGRSVTSRRKARRGKKRVDRDWAEVHRNQNMYRRFDGSALVALGMLVQEFIKENIGPPLPVRRNPKKEEGGHDLPDKPTEPGDARMEDQEEDDEERTSDEGEESPTVVGVDDYDDSDSDDD